MRDYTHYACNHAYTPAHILCLWQYYSKQANLSCNGCPLNLRKYPFIHRYTDSRTIQRDLKKMMVGHLVRPRRRSVWKVSWVGRRTFHYYVLRSYSFVIIFSCSYMMETGAQNSLSLAFISLTDAISYLTL